jgi:hypothetical protein
MVSLKIGDSCVAVLPSRWKNVHRKGDSSRSIVGREIAGDASQEVVLCLAVHQDCRNPVRVGMSDI